LLVLQWFLDLRRYLSDFPQAKWLRSALPNDGDDWVIDQIEHRSTMNSGTSEASRYLDPIHPSGDFRVSARKQPGITRPASGTGMKCVSWPLDAQNLQKCWFSVGHWIMLHFS
jgi:hypothetical protein